MTRVLESESSGGGRVTAVVRRAVHPNGWKAWAAIGVSLNDPICDIGQIRSPSSILPSGVALPRPPMAYFQAGMCFPDTRRAFPFRDGVMSHTADRSENATSKRIDMK